MDPFHHPDLAELGRRLQRHLDDVLEAEQYAAYVSARRRRSMRDRLVELEDREELVTAVTATVRYHGRLAAVGADHVVIATAAGPALIALDQLVAVETVE